MPSVHLHYWAGAKAAAGTAEETVEAPSVRSALDLAGAHRDERFRRVLGACSLLLDGVAAHAEDLDQPLTKAVRVEVLPPFAGGASARAPLARAALGELPPVWDRSRIGVPRSGPEPV